MTENITLQRYVEQLPVEVLILLIQRHVLILVHRRQEGTRSGQSVPGMVDMGGCRVGGSSVGWGGEGGGGGVAGGLQDERTGVVDVSLGGEPSDGRHLSRIVSWRLILTRGRSMVLGRCVTGVYHGYGSDETTGALVSGVRSTALIVCTVVTGH